MEDKIVYCKDCRFFQGNGYCYYQGPNQIPDTRKCCPTYKERFDVKLEHILTYLKKFHLATMEKKIIRFLKKSHILPIYRVDILRYARENREAGLCRTLGKALDDFGIDDTKYKIFPLFTYENAKRFRPLKNYGYWWIEHEWTSGRLDFLDWLIDQYKDDKEDLRKLYQ